MIADKQFTSSFERLNAFANTLRRSRSSIELRSSQNAFASPGFDNTLERNKKIDCSQNETCENEKKIRNKELSSQPKVTTEPSHSHDRAWLRQRICENEQFDCDPDSRNTKNECSAAVNELFDLDTNQQILEDQIKPQPAFTCSSSDDPASPSRPLLRQVLSSLSVQLSPPGKKITDKRYLLCQFRDFDARLTRLEAIERTLSPMITKDTADEAKSYDPNDDLDWLDTSEDLSEVTNDALQEMNYELDLADVSVTARGQSPSVNTDNQLTDYSDSSSEFLPIATEISVDRNDLEERCSKLAASEETTASAEDSRENPRSVNSGKQSEYLAAIDGAQDVDSIDLQHTHSIAIPDLEKSAEDTAATDNLLPRDSILKDEQENTKGQRTSFYAKPGTVTAKPGSGYCAFFKPRDELDWKKESLIAHRDMKQNDSDKTKTKRRDKVKRLKVEFSTAVDVCTYEGWEADIED
ncbi:uncharacterized protein V2V93DRAFT_359931 [Kockiozyma suomiensis]|uniref:uncharacterized protein n=1 Tax=Kockiozyma suomiensis TaxID=1337062 RepID=UPI00334354F1